MLARTPQDTEKLVIGGRRIAASSGRNFETLNPAIFAGVEDEMRISQEEIFGPVAAVIPSRTRMMRSASPMELSIVWRPTCGPATLDARTA